MFNSFLVFPHFEKIVTACNPFVSFIYGPPKWMGVYFLIVDPISLLFAHIGFFIYFGDF